MKSLATSQEIIAKIWKDATKPKKKKKKNLCECP
jgi:hypothetical protein